MENINQDTLDSGLEPRRVHTALDKALRSIAREVIAATGASFCRAFLFHDKSEYGNYYLTEQYQGFIAPDPPDLFTQAALETGRIIYTSDAEHHPLTNKYVVQFHNLKACIAFPIIHSGETIAAGVAMFKEPHEFTQRECDDVLRASANGAEAVYKALLYSRGIDEAVAIERERISNELHDGIAQVLSSVRMHLGSVLLLDLPQEARDELEITKTVVDDAITEVRDVVLNYRSFHELDKGNMEDFKRDLHSIERRSGLTIDDQISEDSLAMLSRHAKMQLSRILGESLTNVRKHAQANHVVLQSNDNGRAVVITVTDDGMGFSQLLDPSDESVSFGMHVMQERARDFGGSVEYKNVLPHGAQVVITIPYR